MINRKHTYIIGAAIVLLIGGATVWVVGSRNKSPSTDTDTAQQNEPSAPATNVLSFTGFSELVDKGVAVERVKSAQLMLEQYIKSEAPTASVVSIEKDSVVCVDSAAESCTFRILVDGKEALAVMIGYDEYLMNRLVINDEGSIVYDSEAAEYID